MSEWIAQRYEVHKTLGKGGMAVVYQVLDAATGTTLALKRLTVDRENQKKAEEIARLFEYEFWFLTQLSHPRVVAVYDFGKDEQGSYYTMELLDGGDLRDLSPLPWAKACSFFYDVCSVLGLLHSRRQLHRDLSPRNLRCTKDGTAKVIDFGAITPMGPCKEVIGTPPFTAPEVLTLQALDARADLFSVGAALYFALTGRHAFPARNFGELRDLWRSKLNPPSSFFSDIPEDLDNLVLALMSIDRVARPVNAAEVMEKLSAIGGFEVGNQLSVGQSYLSMPNLVGREAQVIQARKLIRRSLRGHGGTLLIEGEAGIGRSRLLDACVLEGKLGGAVVLRVDASDSRSGNWGGVRALVSALIKALPEVAAATVKPYASILSQIVPGLLSLRTAVNTHASTQGIQVTADLPGGSGRRDTGSPSDFDAERSSLSPVFLRHIISTIPPGSSTHPQEMRPRFQAALRDFLLAVSEQRCLMVAVDDLHRLDEPSAALIALLAHEMAQKMFTIVMTAVSGAPSISATALKLVREAGDSFKLRELSEEQTEQLLGSVFGEAPNLRLLADRLNTVCRGNPRSIMQLNQHLVDSGLIRYQSGGWTLPSRIDAGDLPGTINEALRTRLGKLSAEASALAQALALSPEWSFTFDQCVSLSEQIDAGGLIRNLDELVAAEVVEKDGQLYGISQPSWVAELTSSLSDHRKRVLHARLAEILQKKDKADDTIESHFVESILVVQHQLSAGLGEQALDTFLQHFEGIRQTLTQNQQAFDEYIQLLPKNWTEIHEALLEVCESLARPKRDRFAIEYSLVTLSSVDASAARVHLTSIIDQLYRESGLSHYQALDTSIPASERLSRALELAQQHYDALPEPERVHTPLEAIGYLAQVVISAIGIVGVSFDYPLIASIPSVEPLIPLSSVFRVIEKNVQSTVCLTAGRIEDARKGYLEALDLLNQPDRGGIDETYYEYARSSMIYAVGLIEASIGMASALKWIEELKAYPLLQVSAVRIQMVYYLRQGDSRKAEELIKRLELLLIQNKPSQFYESAHLFPEILVYSAANDLNALRRTLEPVQDMATRFKDWGPILRFAQGEYQRIRGDYYKALAEFESTWSTIKAGEHIIWPYLASAYLHVLHELGRFQEARRRGREALAVAQNAHLGISCNLIASSLALVEAELGEFKGAIEKLQTVIERYQSEGVTGLYLGLAYETRARVAIRERDDRGFMLYAEKCAEQYKSGRNPALVAKYEKLIQEAQRTALRVTDTLVHAAEVSDVGQATAMTIVADFFGNCHGPQERAERALGLLVEQSHCLGGYLYTVQKAGPVLVARVGFEAAPAEMDAMVGSYLADELEGGEGVTVQGDPADGLANQNESWNLRQFEQYRPLVLGHHTERGYSITGVAVLVKDPTRIFAIPGDAATALSKSLFDAGDVTAIVAAV
jgi:tetratricopeptide (TPR) repeat protein